MAIIKIQKIIPILLVIILLAVFVPQHQASAWCASISGCAQEITSFMIRLVGTAIAWAAQTLNAFIQYQTDNGVYNIFAVDQSWTVVRNFVNLFFILVLIVMAFGTIFDIKKYTWQDLLPSFIIAALLINFSLVIGQYIITLSNGLAGVFLKTIADNGGLSEKFAQGFSQVKIVSSASTIGGALDATGAIAVTGVFSLIWFIIIFLAFLSVAIFSIARLFVLWFLLIISPIAWLGYAMPYIKKQTWTSWWTNFLCWCFFLPYYLFFLMFAVGFIANKDKIPAIPGSASVAIGSMALNDLLLYGVSLIFLVGGLGVAMKMACASGTGVKKVFSTIEGGVRKYAPGAAYLRGSVEGLKARGEQIAEKGILGFGGAQRARLDEAAAKGFVAGRIPGLGKVPGARGTAEKQLVEEISKLRGQFEKITDINELKKLADSGSRQQQLAVREILKDRDELSVDDQLATYKLYGGKDSLAAQKFAKSIDYARLSSEERRRLYTAIDDPEIKRRIINMRADKGDLRDATAEELIRYASLFIQEGDKRELLNKAQKFAFEESIKAQVELKLIKDSAGISVTNVAEAIAEKVRKMRLDDILELSKGSLRGLLQENPEVARIIGARLTKETIASIPGKVDSDRMEILEDILAKRKGELEAQEIQKKKEEAGIQGETQAKAMQPLVDAIKELMETVRGASRPPAGGSTGKTGGPIGFVTPSSQ